MSTIKKLTIGGLSGLEIALSITSLVLMFSFGRSLSELQSVLDIFPLSFSPYVIFFVVTSISILLLIVGVKTFLLMRATWSRTLTTKEGTLINKLAIAGLALLVVELILFFSFYILPVYNIVNSIPSY